MIRLLHSQPYAKARRCQSKLLEKIASHTLYVWLYGTVCTVHVCTVDCADVRSRKKRKEKRRQKEKTPLRGRASKSQILYGTVYVTKIRSIMSVENTIGSISFKKLKIENRNPPSSILSVSLSLCQSAVSIPLVGRWSVAQLHIWNDSSDQSLSPSHKLTAPDATLREYTCSVSRLTSKIFREFDLLANEIACCTTIDTVHRKRTYTATFTNSGTSDNHFTCNTVRLFRTCVH